jgi:tetratricopeptide (TPR) repeat protein
MKDAATAHAQGFSKAALAYAMKALACEPSARLYRLAVTYACAAHDFPAATQYLAKLPSSAERSQVEQKCQQEGMSAPASSSQAEIAARLNAEGKELLFADKPDAAIKKFQEAVARVPEAKYLFNLCIAEFQGGRFGDALVACQDVDRSNPTDDMRRKAAAMIARIKAEAKRQGIELH